MNAASDRALAIRPARPEEWALALALIFRHLPPDLQRLRRQTALELLDSGEFDPEGVRVVAREGMLLAALAATPIPGRSASVWPPQVRPEADLPDHLLDQLVRSTADWLRSRGCRLAQVLVVPEDAQALAPLLRNGFHRVSSLWFLRHDLASLPAPAPPEADWSLQPADPLPDALLEQILEQTYLQTRDFPEISSVRSAREALAGLRESWSWQSRWWVARLKNKPAGILLANPAPDAAGWEIAYLGIVPEFRRRGLARSLLAHVLLDARDRHVPSVTVGVDHRNHPARVLYRQAGFQPTDCRDVLLALWPDLTSSPPTSA